MASEHPEPRRRRFRFWYLTSVFVLLALAAWALASPIGSSPDDEFHLSSIWCGLGERPGLCGPGSSINARAVPAAAAHGGDCFVTKPQKSAACQEKVLSEPGLSSTKYVNTTGLYPPVFYAVMSIFASPNVVVSALVMRVVNILLMIGMIAAVWVLVPRSWRTSMVIGWLVTCVPLGLFLIASNNPSAWAIISASTLWVALVGFFEMVGWRRWTLAGVAVLAVLIGAGARADAALYSVVAVIVAVCLTGRCSWNYLRLLIVPAVLIVVAFLLYMTAGQASSAAAGGLSAGRGSSPLWGWPLLITNLLNMPSLWVGVFGSWPLGWFDTSLPSLVWFVTLTTFVALTVVGVRRSGLGKMVAIVGLMAALWLLPAFLLQTSHNEIGQGVQPRYLLPLIVMLAGVALWRGRGVPFQLTRVQTWFLVIPLTIANSVSLHFDIRRYVSGSGPFFFNLDSHVLWWWPMPVSPMTVWVCGTLAFGLAAYLIVGRLLLPPTAVPRDSRDDPSREVRTMDEEPADGRGDEREDNAVEKRQIEHEATASDAGRDHPASGVGPVTSSS